MIIIAIKRNVLIFVKILMNCKCSLCRISEKKFNFSILIIINQQGDLKRKLKAVRLFWYKFNKAKIVLLCLLYMNALDI